MSITDVFLGFFKRISSAFKGVDWLLLGSVLPIIAVGLLAMNSFVGEQDFYHHQLIWVALAIAVFFVLSVIDFRFLRRTWVLVTLFGISVALLLGLFISARIVRGTQS